jgi:hypothetical protein
MFVAPHTRVQPALLFRADHLPNRLNRLPTGFSAQLGEFFRVQDDLVSAFETDDHSVDSMHFSLLLVLGLAT